MEVSKRTDGSIAVEGFIQWATQGLPLTLADTVRASLMTIARTGECLEMSAAWVLFGEVQEVSVGPPYTVHLRRTSMVMNEFANLGDSWDNIELICPVAHTRVDFAPGSHVGFLSKPADRPFVGRIIAGETVPVWNVSSFDKNIAWNVTHLFAEGWLRAMWWLQQANLGHSFSSHTSVDWCPDVMKTWCFNHGKEHLRTPIPTSFDPKEVFTGILADVGDTSLLRATASKVNLLVTLSPPCPSWSRGGKNSGLASA